MDDPRRAGGQRAALRGPGAGGVRRRHRDGRGGRHAHRHRRPQRLVRPRGRDRLRRYPPPLPRRGPPPGGDRDRGRRRGPWPSHPAEPPCPRPPRPVRPYGAGPRRPDPAPDAHRPAARRVPGRGEPGRPRPEGQLLARLRDGDRAHRLLAGQLADSTLPNLWDTHPPFQIDGNSGAAAGIAQMLPQSHRAVLDVLPALPGRWPDGSVRGLRAHGDLTVDITWRAGRARTLTVAAGHDGPVRIRSDLFARPYTAYDDTTGRETAVRDDPGYGDARTVTLAARGGHTYRFTERA
ncbi:glycoside hydrolase family 95-like protein [Streptomyces sp. BRA346]|uniref:glycoside hydrolase family 95-like protein n=1 Tax=Streptomyces sp. BRA346 TaxID=2878199 RepID=UPI0040645B51